MANPKRKITIYINDKEVIDSLGGIGREISKLKRLRKQADDPKDRQKYNEQLKEAKRRYAELNEEFEDTTATLGDVKNAFSGIIDGFLSGDLDRVKEGFNAINTSVKGVIKSSAKLLLTPFGLLAAAIGGLLVGFKKWVDFNLEIEKTNEQVKQLTNQTGIAVDAIRIRAQVLKDTFDVEVSESINAAKSLVEGFGISYDQAFDIIEKGAVNGKIKNDEFLDSIKEYPVQFKNAGFSAEDFANIVSTGIDLSIYKDKLPDAIKEFNLSITEQTKPAKDALKNAFGEKFTKDLFKGIKNGSLTAKDALALIAKESKRVGLNSQQAQQLTADLFKGAGEDAGGAIKIFEAVNMALNDQKKPLTELQKIQKKQLDTNKELKGVYTQLFAAGNSTFSKLIAKGKLFATKTLLAILKGGVDVYNWFVDLNNESSFFSGILSSLGKLATSSFEVIGILLSETWNSVKGLGNMMAGAFTLDWDRFKKGASQGVGAIGNVIEKLKNKAVTDVNEIYDAFTGKNKFEKISLTTLVAEKEVKKVEKGNGNGKGNEDEKGELTAEDKRIIESKKKLKEFLDNWKEEQELQKELEGLEGEARAEEEDILRLEKKFADMEREAGLTAEKEAELSEEDLRLKKELEEARGIEIDKIRKKYADKREKELAKRQKRIEKETQKHHKRLAKAELDLEMARQKARDFGISSLKNMFGQKTGIYKALFALEKALAISDVLNNASKSIAQITANTAIANSKAIAASPLTAGMPFVGINSVVAGKQITATKINAGVEIAKIAASGVAGFEKGKYPVLRNDGKVFDAELGGPTRTMLVDRPTLMQDYLVGERRRPELIVDDITLSKVDPNVVKYILDVRDDKAGGKFPGYEDGKYPEVSSQVTDQIETTNTQDLTQAVNKLNDLLANGIQSQALIGDEQIEEFNQRNELLSSSRNKAKIN